MHLVNRINSRFSTDINCFRIVSTEFSFHVHFAEPGEGSKEAPSRWAPSQPIHLVLKELCQVNGWSSLVSPVEDDQADEGVLGQNIAPTC